MLAVPGVDLAVHTDRPILSTGAYLDFKRHVGNLLQQRNHGHRSGFRPSCKRPCPWLIVGRYPSYNLHPALMPIVQDVTGLLAASSSRSLAPGVGVQSWFKEARLQRRPAAYHGCYEEDCLSEAMVAEAGSGLCAGHHPDPPSLAIAGVESGVAG